jgi:signal transduction histidine kinase/CheY-like chemotaxis protein
MAVPVWPPALTGVRRRPRKTARALARALVDRDRAAAALADISRALALGLAPEAIGREIVERVRVVFGAAATVLLRWESAPPSLVAVAGAGEVISSPRGPLILPEGMGLAGLAAVTRRPLASADVVGDPRVTLPDEVREHLTGTDLRAVLAVPLLQKDRVLGVLAIGDRRGRRFRPSEIRLARSFADQGVLMLEMARLHVDARSRQVEAEINAVEAESREQILQATLDHLPQGLSVIDRGLRLVAWNTRFLDLLGFPRSMGMAGTPIEAFFRYQAGRGELGTDDPEGEVARRVAEVGRLEAYQQDHVRPDGTVLEIRATPWAGGGLVTTYTDVTEHRRREETLRRTEAEIRQGQKMEAVGRLAGGVAHDFNNLLTVITGRSEILLQRLSPEEPLRRHVDSIQRTAFKAAELIHQLLAFSRKQVRQPRVLDLNQVVAGAEELLRRLIGEHIELQSRHAPHLGRVQADPAQLEQVLLNLVVNARDAMPRGGLLRIETADVVLDRAFVESHLGSRPGPFVRLTVSDTGLGMSAETRARVFEPFFTTKPPGQGTGLGLATVYGIVKQSDGYIWVDSEEGQGARFDVYLPRVDAPAEALPSVLAPVGLPQGSETILLVEDEDEVRELAREVLQLSGYTLLVARHGREALALAQAYRGSIDLLLTDVVMPHMSGRDLAQRLQEERPTLRVLYMSGYTEDAIVHHGVLDHDAQLLPKPFRSDTLATTVRDQLDARPGGLAAGRRRS